MDPNSAVFKRIYSLFNDSLFGTVSARSENLIAEDGNYDDELEQFNAELFADPPVEEALPLLADLHLQPLSELDGVEPTPEFPTAQSEHHVSISVTSRVSTQTVVAPSRVSGTISSSVAISSVEHAVEGPSSPPSPKAKRPATKKGGKSSKKKSVPIDPPTRTLRNRG